MPETQNSVDALHGLAMAQRIPVGRLLGRCYCGVEWQVESLPELREALVTHKAADPEPRV